MSGFILHLQLPCRSQLQSQLLLAKTVSTPLYHYLLLHSYSEICDQGICNVCVQLSKLKRRMLTEYKLAARTLTKYNGSHSGVADEDEGFCGGFYFAFLF